MKEKKQNEIPETKKLKPVIFSAVNKGKSTYGYYAPDKGRQLLLLKALKVTQDPKKLKDMIGVGRVASVYRLLDRISATKEYHRALVGNGVTMDFIVEGIKKEATSELNKSADRLKAYNILMKSLGIDNYEESGVVGGSWEDVLTKKVEEERKINMIEGEIVEGEIEEYEVQAPKLPEAVKKIQEEERAVGRSLYE